MSVVRPKGVPRRVAEVQSVIRQSVIRTLTSSVILAIGYLALGIRVPAME